MKATYQTLADLPRSLKDELPDMAQRTYLSTYQRVWEKCRMGGMESEDELARTAHEAATLAVRAQFEKDEQGRWRNAPVSGEVRPGKVTPEND